MEQVKKNSTFADDTDVYLSDITNLGLTLCLISVKHNMQ